MNVANLESRLGPDRRALVPPFQLGRLGNQMFMYAALVGLARSPELSPYSPIILIPEPSNFSFALAPYLDALSVCICNWEPAECAGLRLVFFLLVLAASHWFHFMLSHNWKCWVVITRDGKNPNFFCPARGSFFRPGP